MGAERAHPNEIGRLDLHPRIVEEIHALSLQHEQAVLHDVGFRHGQAVSDVEREDVHRHVVGEIVGYKNLQARARISLELSPRNLLLRSGQRSVHGDSIGRFVALSQKEYSGLLFGIDGEAAAGRHQCIPALRQLMPLAVNRERERPGKHVEEKLDIAVSAMFAPLTSLKLDHIFHELSAESRAGEHPNLRSWPFRQARIGDSLQREQRVTWSDARSAGKQLILTSHG